MPQVTSYDYDALLDEEGNQLLNTSSQEDDGNHFPEYPPVGTLYKKHGKGSSIGQSFTLFETLDESLSQLKASIQKRWKNLVKAMAHLLYRTGQELGCRRGTSPSSWT